MLLKSCIGLIPGAHDGLGSREILCGLPPPTTINESLQRHALKHFIPEKKKIYQKAASLCLIDKATFLGTRFVMFEDNLVGSERVAYRAHVHIVTYAQGFSCRFARNHGLFGRGKDSYQTTALRVYRHGLLACCRRFRDGRISSYSHIRLCCNQPVASLSKSDI